MQFSFFQTQASSTYYCLVRRPRNTFIRLPLLLTKCQLKMKTLWSSLGNLVGEPQLCHCFHHSYLALWDILTPKTCKIGQLLYNEICRVRSFCMNKSVVGTFLLYILMIFNCLENHQNWWKMSKLQLYIDTKMTLHISF